MILIKKRKKILKRKTLKKAFLKSANNVPFGKTFEKVRKRIDIELIYNKVILTKRISKPTYVKNFAISDNLILIQ